MRRKQETNVTCPACGTELAIAGKKVSIAENHADFLSHAPQFIMALRQDIDAIDENFPLCGILQAVHHAQERRFSGAAESNDTKDIPICNGKVHILKGIYHA